MIMGALIYVLHEKILSKNVIHQNKYNNKVSILVCCHLCLILDSTCTCTSSQAPPTMRKDRNKNPKVQKKQYIFNFRSFRQ